VWSEGVSGELQLTPAAHCFASLTQSDAVWEDLAKITVTIESWTIWDGQTAWRGKMPTRKRAGPQGDHFSGFDRSLECLERISDIQRQTGKPISMPTANVP